MLPARRRFLLLFVGVLLFLLTMLANGVGGLTFAPARPFDFGRGEDITALTAGQIMPLITLGLVLGVFILIFLVPRDIWRHGRAVGAAVGSLAICALGVMWLSSTLPAMELQPTPVAEQTPTAAETPTADTLPPLAPPVELIPVPQQPAWVTWLASGLLALFLGGMALWVGRRYWLPAEPPPALHQIAQQAQAALDNLQAGDEWQEVIIRCYLEMGRVLADSRAIERPQSMTPREFESQLLALGLPSVPVSQLTRLFEATRYGRQTADPAQQQTAVAALQAIAEACQSVS